MVQFVSNKDVRSLTMTSNLSTLDVSYSQQYINPSDKGPIN